MSHSISPIVRIVAPDIFPADAVGNFCIDLCHLLQGANYKVYLYASNFLNDGDEVVLAYEQLFDDLNESDVLFVSYSIYDGNINRILKLQNQKICYFHGVTPPQLLEKFEPATVSLCARSFDQFPLLGHFDRVFANSKFSAQFLDPYVDISAIEIIPPIFSDRLLARDINYEVRFAENNLEILHVGRVVPHKCIEDAISMVAELNSLRGDVTFNVVGDCPNAEYLMFLKSHAMALGIDKLVRFSGKVGEEILGEYYQVAHALITTSNHEGFCIPVLEAMYCGIPVLIKRGTAADEVAGDAAISWHGNDPVKAAKSILGVLQDRGKITSLVEKAHQRAETLLLLNTLDLWEKRLDLSYERGCCNVFS